MATRGKHEAKNHPKTKGNGIVPGIIILSGVILFSTAAARMATRKDPEIHLKPGIFATKEYDDVKDLLSGISSNYKMEDVYGLTDIGLVFQYYQNELKGLSPEEQREKIKELINDDDLYAKVIFSVEEAKNEPSFEFELVDVDQNNIEVVKNNENVMQYIQKYCQEYKINQDVIIAILATNVHSGTLNPSNPFGLNGFWNGSVNSTRTVWNYEDGTKDDLMIMQRTARSSIESAIRYGIMVYASSAKEANGNTEDTLRIFYSSPYPEYAPRSNTMNEDKFKDSVLTYVATMNNTTRVKLNYVFTLSESYAKEMHEVYENGMNYDEICDLVDQINTQIGTGYRHVAGNKIL